jgi:hypothetical protein
VIPVPCLLLRAGLSVIEGTGVFLFLTELPIRKLLLELIRLPELPADGFLVLGIVVFLVLIKLPIRELLVGLIRLLGLATGDFGVRGADCFFVLIGLPIREVLLELTRLLGLVAGDFGVRGADGFLVLIRPPIREVLPVLIRLLELVDTRFPAPELVPVSFLLPIELLNGLRAPLEVAVLLLTGRVPEAIGGRRVVGRLGVSLSG